MSVLSCPHNSHRGKPVPLAETANDVFTCVSKHKFVLESDPDIGKVLRDLSSGILHEVSSFDMDGAAYVPELHYANPTQKPSEQTFEMQIVPIAEDVEEPPPAPSAPPPEPEKKVRKISTVSIPYVMPETNLNALNLTPQEWKLFARINGRDNIKDVVQASRLNEKEAYQMLGGLIKRGLVGVKE